MKNDDLKAKVKKAFYNAVPDVLDSVLGDCKEQKGNIVMMKEKKKSNVWLKSIAGLAAALILIVGGITGVNFYNANYAVVSTVSLDVNPSIEIKVNEKERILEVNPLNEEAKIVVGDMDFKDADLDVTVYALIGSMLRNGYLNEMSNSILISVDSKNPDKGNSIQQKLTDEVSEILTTDSFSGAVLSQTIVQNEEVEALAETYGITLGKAQLIQQIVSKNPLYTFKDLVSLSINELNLLCSSASTPLESVSSVGTASDKNYIGVDRAKEIALQNAGMLDSDVIFTETKLDYEDGIMVYEIEFTSGGYEYEYEINAKTGDIITSEKDFDDDKQPSSNNGETVSPESFIGEDKAKEAALSHAGVNESDITNYKIKLDRDDGVYFYEVDFKAGNYEYDYEINAMTGAVIKNEKEADYTAANPGTTAKPSGSETLISEAKAKETALSHAGVKVSDIITYKSELDKDDGLYVYEIEFKAGGYEYDYDINAVTGEVIKHEKEIDDDSSVNTGTTTGSEALIGEDKAKETALSHAGVKASDINNYKVELDRDDGLSVYEIEFEAGAYEYDYEINAKTGAIIKSEKEHRD